LSPASTTAENSASNLEEECLFEQKLPEETLLEGFKYGFANTHFNTPGITVSSYISNYSYYILNFRRI